MDNLTHTLMGVALSRAGFNRLTPQAGWLMVAASNVPDADIVLSFASPLVYLDQHRGPSHGLAWAPLVALLPLLLWRVLMRGRAVGRREWLGAYGASLGGVLIHDLIDCFNTYGVRLGLPFREDWVWLDWLPIADPWIWAMLAVAIAATQLSRLLSGEMGARRPTGRAASIAALILMVLWTGGRGWMHERAVAVLDARLYDGERALRVRALPAIESPLRWRGLVRTAGAWRTVEVNLLEEFNPDAARVHYDPAPSAALTAAKATRAGHSFLRFAQAAAWRVDPAPEPEGAVLVSATDLRFGDPQEGRFTLQVLVDGAARPLGAVFGFDRMEPPKP